MVTYAATLDVPRHIVVHLSRLLAAHRRRLGTPRVSRALGTFRQAVLVLRWFRERGCVHCLARDAGISQATSYRYLHEGLDILPAQAPDLHEVLDRCREEKMSHVILDGMLIESDRLAGTRDNGNDLLFSQKHKSFGGNVQFLSAPDGTPLWVSDVEPGSTPDLTAARLHVLPALYKAAADGLPTLADTGDPAKLARALLTIADQQQPPLRFVAGADAIEGVKAKAQELLAQAEASRELGGNLAYVDSIA
ncbi:transposase family protein [Streptomyces aurantiogriseus]|uniref:DDE Tnp4 domain-containing protein n=1 Tax=Streptomyces aurantiogriseus TaxID=66870 RepID=A0A918F5F4_9ACTN|nr:transposase family protein [Streptomyces aurantiogriseus]GGR09603.1 hypothetical protein GCM10010251_26740 [Streptomyces aurantiogriseus]